MFCFTGMATQYIHKINVNLWVWFSTVHALFAFHIRLALRGTVVIIMVYLIWEVADQLWISAEIKRGSVMLVSPTVLPTTTEDTFGSLLDKVGNSSLDQNLELQVETVEKVTISGAAASTVHVVPLNAPVLTVSSVTASTVL